MAAEKFSVVQSPSRVEAAEGERVSLSCAYTGDVGSGIGGYQWLKHSPHGVPVSNDTEGYRGRVHRKTARQFIGTRDASIAISDVRQSDSGIYYCLGSNKR
uniref:Natural cytotoxicity triggering receptor 3 n=1 Tax=Callorhinchus milii TaxID=7868 RepID=A0A4W3GHK8_CALMI